MEIGRRWPVTPSGIVVKFGSTVIVSKGQKGDKAGWLTADGHFSVRSSYELEMGRAKVAKWSGWKLIWRLRVQQRVRVFVWLLAHQKILTNACQRRRKLTDNLGCKHCLGGVKDAIHMIRDCTASKEIWNFSHLPRQSEISLEASYNASYR